MIEPTIPETFGARIDGWPWVKSITLVGVWSFVLTQLAAGAVTAALLFVPTLRPSAADAFLLDRALRLYELTSDAAIWCMGAGALGIVGKRATTKSSVIAAETDAAVATGRAPEATPDLRQTDTHVATATAAAQPMAFASVAPRAPAGADDALPPELARPEASERGEEDDADAR